MVRPVPALRVRDVPIGLSVELDLIAQVLIMVNEPIVKPRPPDLKRRADKCAGLFGAKVENVDSPLFKRRATRVDIEARPDCKGLGIGNGVTIVDELDIAVKQHKRNGPTGANGLDNSAYPWFTRLVDLYPFIDLGIKAPKLVDVIVRALYRYDRQVAIAPRVETFRLARIGARPKARNGQALEASAPLASDIARATG